MATIKDIIAAVNSEMKSKVVMSLGATKKRVIDGVSSGSVWLNEKLSGNPLVGYAYGRIVEIFGPEQSGKTTFSLHAVSEAQKLGLSTGYIDAEHALDTEYAKNIGVNVDDLAFCQPETGEQALDTVLSLVRNGTNLIVVDSVPALVPLAELEGDMDTSHMGIHARMMGKALRKLVGLCAKSNAIVIFINQIRMKLGVMFGNPETTPGGKALPYFASYRIDVRSPRGGAIVDKHVGEDKVETGIVANVKIIKNKVYPPYRSHKIKIVYGKGIDKYDDIGSYLSAYASNNGKIKLCGKFYSEKNAIELLKSSKQARQEALAYIKSIAKGGNE